MREATAYRTHHICIDGSLVTPGGRARLTNNTSARESASTGCDVSGGARPPRATRITLREGAAEHPSIARKASAPSHYYVVFFRRSWRTQTQRIYRFGCRAEANGTRESRPDQRSIQNPVSPVLFGEGRKAARKGGVPARRH